MLHRMRLAVALLVPAIAASARADSVTNQVIVSATQATEANPRSTVFTDMLNSSFDIGDAWTVSAGASITLEGETPAASRAQFGQSGSAVTLFSAGVDWSATNEEYRVFATPSRQAGQALEFQDHRMRHII